MHTAQARLPARDGACPFVTVPPTLLISQVTAHDGEEGATVILIKFDASVLEREKRLA